MLLFAFCVFKLPFPSLNHKPQAFQLTVARCITTLFFLIQVFFIDKNRLFTALALAKNLFIQIASSFFKIC